MTRIWTTSEIGRAAMHELEIIDAALSNYAIGVTRDREEYFGRAASLLSRLNPNSVTQNTRDIYNLIISGMKARGYPQPARQ